MFIFLIICIIVLLWLLWKEKNNKIEQITINTKKQEENLQIENKNKELLNQLNNITTELKTKNAELKNVQTLITMSEDVSKQSFERYNDELDNNYILAEQEYDKSIILLKQSYNNIQDKINAEIASISNDLDKISATRTAAIQAQLHEQEIKEQDKFYSLAIDEVSLHEIKILQGIESSFRDPRPIKMIIWTSYYSKKANELIARILKGDTKITGIYKITNKQNQLCYIGQARDIKERIREHMKFGLGIDTPANNKLYQAMQEDGLENFTFELLEECSVEQLDEKEAFYIGLYNAYTFGYNSTKGNKKS